MTCIELFPSPKGNLQLTREFGEFPIKIFLVQLVQAYTMALGPEIESYPFWMLTKFGIM